MPKAKIVNQASGKRVVNSRGGGKQVNGQNSIRIDKHTDTCLNCTKATCWLDKKDTCPILRESDKWQKQYKSKGEDKP